MKARSALSRFVWVLLALAAAGGAGCVGYRKWQARDRLEESCANCRKFVRLLFREYSETHDGWFPHGGVTPLDSLAQCVQAEHEVHHFTSHALSKSLIAFWKEHHTFSPELTCYRYNEGIRADDENARPELIILYFHRPTFFECKSPVHKQSQLGRPVMLTANDWTFLPEAEFQKQQAATLAFLEQRGRLKKPSPAP